jgi:hypothetical protein
MTPYYGFILYTSYELGSVGGIQEVYLFGQGSGWVEGYKVLHHIKIERRVLFRESIAGNATQRDYFKVSLDKTGAWNCSFKIWVRQ